MNRKQKTLRLKRLNERKKLYKKFGFWSYLAIGNSQVRKARTQEYLEVSNGIS